MSLDTSENAIDPMLSAAGLHDSLQDVVVLDCRFSLADTTEGQRLYNQGHIPGAHYCDLEQHLSAPKQAHGGRHPLPEPLAFQRQLAQWGIRPDSRVVVYDNNRLAFASRAWWLLRQAGIEQVQLLNGGFNAWCNAGYPQATDMPALSSSAPGSNTLTTDSLTYDQVRQLAGEQACPLIDSREAPRYRGEVEPIDPVAGHIPGATNLPWTDICDEEGFIKPEAFHNQRWAPFRGEEPVVYCGSGVTACVNLLSAHLANQPARLYAGSWSDWCSYSDAPIATAITNGN
ncbi:sulfurtransferase [Pseudomaricurvus sp. HS19]|uniref:sulfurtransferase n=1 Tax=Pseudomaricurvus sp. HS19 TaxID=2692626 RepID=UPI00136BC48F|nr:sulfurtransferase [Pseudomaricurvus sp. HS19]MYM62080.1 sulfurtransferase [Pseudomaricurvus sp. HS19]